MPGVRSSSCLAITRPELAVRLRMCETPDPPLLTMLRNAIATAKVHLILLPISQRGFCPTLILPAVYHPASAGPEPKPPPPTPEQSAATAATSAGTAAGATSALTSACTGPP